MKKFVAGFILASTISAIAQQVPEKIEIRTEVVNAVLQYLGTRPYNEVNGLIVNLQSDAKQYIDIMNKKDAEKKEKSDKKDKEEKDKKG